MMESLLTCKSICYTCTVVNMYNRQKLILHKILHKTLEVIIPGIYN